MAPLLRVERADPHEPVDAALGRQQPVGVVPADGERRRLDARLLAVVDLVDLDVERRAAPPIGRTSAGACRPNPATRSRRRRPGPSRSRHGRRTRRRAVPPAGARRAPLERLDGGRELSARSGSSASLRSSSIAIASSSLRWRSSTRSSSAFSRASSEVIRRPFAGSSHSDGSAACCWRSAACARFVSRSKEPPGRLHAVGDRRQPLRVLAHRRSLPTARAAANYRPDPAGPYAGQRHGGDRADTLLPDAEADLRSLVVLDEEPVTWLLIEAPGRPIRPPGPGGGRADDRDGRQDPRHRSPGAIHESRRRRGTWLTLAAWTDSAVRGAAVSGYCHRAELVGATLAELPDLLAGQRPASCG